jgi:hypothetical protein
MLNPARALAKEFVHRSPTTLLAFGIAISLLDFVAIYIVAANEGVLHVSQGIGLLNNYGLLSTILGNAISLYVAKKYYDGVCSIRTSSAVVKTAPVETSLSTLKDMIEMRGKYQFLIYLLVTIGALLWLSNVAFHVIGDPEVRWGHKVFDSPDHPLTFFASRLHNLYTWLIIMPIVGHVMIYSSFQLRQAIAIASSVDALTYDLLNPDQRGGFAFVDRAHVSFNVVVALVYIQITMHIETFAKMNSEHIIGYIILTVLLVGINRMFLGHIYATIKKLRLESLNKVKDEVYQNDRLSFEILKYCYERRISAASIVNFILNPGVIVVSGIVKLWPVISKAFTGA